MVFLVSLKCDLRLSYGYTSAEFNGTRIWSPPEVIAENRFRADSTTVWSLGCLLFDMICGDIPFRKEEDIVKGSFKYFRVSRQNLFSPSLPMEDLIEKCLRRRPEDRISLRSILNHPFCDTTKTTTTFISVVGVRGKGIGIDDGMCP